MNLHATQIILVSGNHTSRFMALTYDDFHEYMEVIIKLMEQKVSNIILLYNYSQTTKKLSPSQSSWTALIVWEIRGMFWVFNSVTYGNQSRARNNIGHSLNSRTLHGWVRHLFYKVSSSIIECIKWEYAMVEQSPISFSFFQAKQ